MEFHPRKINPPTATASSSIQHDRRTIQSFNSKQHEPLLHQISNAFGFGAKESTELVEQAYVKTSRTSSLFHQNARVELAKYVVQQCVFQISCKMFSQQFPERCFPGEATSMNYRMSSQVLKMPLSFRTVYILFQVGFSEKEISYILNINTLQVRERLARAGAIVNER